MTVPSQAKELDHTEEYSEQLKWLGHRLWLRSQLYHTPSSSLDQAAQIVEQVPYSRSSADIFLRRAMTYMYMYLYTCTIGIYTRMYVAMFSDVLCAIGELHQ